MFCREPLAIALLPAQRAFDRAPVTAAAEAEFAVSVLQVPFGAVPLPGKGGQAGPELVGLVQPEAFETGVGGSRVPLFSLLPLFAHPLQRVESFLNLAGKVAEREWMGEQGLVDYWQRVSYDLDPLHIEGLRCFYLLLEKHGLIEAAPEIEFFE